MTVPERSSCDISERPSSIVRIAYHQLSIMHGARDPTVPASNAAPASNADATHSTTCLHRLLMLPLFAAVTSAVRDAYIVTKGSHEAVGAILGRAEDGMRAGLELASPVTGRLAGALETPLKTVDNAVCVGLDFVEERMPSVTDSIRYIFTSTLENLRLLFGGSKNRIEDSPVASETTQEEMQKVSS